MAKFTKLLNNVNNRTEITINSFSNLLFYLKKKSLKGWIYTSYIISANIQTTCC